MDKLRPIKTEAKKIEKTAKSKATRSTAKQIERQAEHELAEVKNKEWIKNPKKGQK